MYFDRDVRFVTSCVILATLLAGGKGLVIKDLRGPEIIKNGSQSAVVLDCDYTFEGESREGLVVKWFFNQNPTPVYQWISSQKPQDLGILKGKLNLDYRASEEEHKKHRALQILNPTPELSGEYKCTVSTFDTEQSHTKKMVIFVPEKSLEVTQTKLRDNSAVNITCSAEGVFPEPKLSILTDARTKLDNVQVVTIPRNGLYDIYASIVIDDDDIDDEQSFECELEIPEANYTVKKASIYYPGPPTTTSDDMWWSSTTSDPTSEMPESNFIDSNSSSSISFTWYLLLAALLSLRL